MSKVTGPVKFTFMTGRVQRTALAFWCVMIKREMFHELGFLDEAFSPGMGEDGDFCIKAELAGHQLVQVPVDGSHEFGQHDSSVQRLFPIQHKGSGTFADLHSDDVIKRNTLLLDQRYGGEVISCSIIIPTRGRFSKFKECVDAVLTYTDMSDKELIVVPNGCQNEHYEYLSQLIRKYNHKVNYSWYDQPVGYVNAVNTGIDLAVGEHIVLLDADAILMPQLKDAWISTLRQPFLDDPTVGATSPLAHEYDGLCFVLHSGCTMYKASLLRKIGKFDEVFNPGFMSDADVSKKIWNEGYRCVEVPVDRANKTYKDGVFKIEFPLMHVSNPRSPEDMAAIEKNSAILYERYAAEQKIKYSIVIPTYNHLEDLLKPCIESIIQYTELSDVEIIVVANGCTDGTAEWFMSQIYGKYGRQHQLFVFSEPLGYTKATNEGIKVAKGEYVVLLNNDTVLLPQPKNQWLDMLEAPFKSKQSVGLTGPLKLHDDYANYPVLIFFCVMIKKEVFGKIGYLDEVFSPGGGEDIDFSIRAERAGYTAEVADGGVFGDKVHPNTGALPIYHKENKTFVEQPEYTNYIVKRNGLLNCKRYNSDIKLNIGAGGVNYPGYLSVDLNDKRADVLMDVTKLDFADDCVSEILASHVFEHLNPYHALDILKGWLRVLKQGGKLVMEMPDIEQLCARFVNASTQERYGILNAVYGSVNTSGTGGPDEITSPHLFGWWPQSVFDHLTNAGFTDIQFKPEQIPHPESNFRVEATKPVLAIDHARLQQEEPILYYDIFVHNSYQTELYEIRGKTVIDCGANVGYFALKCLAWGAAQIIAVEGQAVVYREGLVRNVAKYAAIRPVFAALAVEDGHTVRIVNQHIGSHVSDQGDPVQTISLASLLTRVTGDDLVLKMDIEGSEFDVLAKTETSTLRRFSTIYIELHGDGGTKVGDLRNRLRLDRFDCVHSVQQTEGMEGKIPADIWVEKWLRRP